MRPRWQVGPNPNGDLDSTEAWGKVVLLPPSQYVEEAEKATAEAEKAAAADSLREEVLPLHPSESRLEEPWSLYFQFPSKDAARKYALVKMYERDITYGSLLNVMVRNGYGSEDSICYLRKDGIGMQGISVITNNTEVDDMIKQFKTSQTLCLYVKEGKLNRKQAPVEPEEVDPAETLVDLTVDQLVVFAVNESGVVHKTTDHYGGSSYVLATQESVNYMPIKTIPPPCQLVYAKTKFELM